MPENLFGCLLYCDVINWHVFSSCVYYSETESDDDCEAADALNDCDDGDDCDNDECECSCVQRRRSRRGPTSWVGRSRQQQQQREQSSSSSSSSEAAAAAPASPVPPAAPAAPVQCWPPDRVTSIGSCESCDNVKVSLGRVMGSRGVLRFLRREEDEHGFLPSQSWSVNISTPSLLL